MDWASLRGRWPNAEASTFVQARPHRWHVQILGPDTAPVLLLLHGAGGATHSWRRLGPILARTFRVVMPDLPGHGFTKLGAMQRSSLPLMASDLFHLLDKLDVTPAALIGHSAGGALALQMAMILRRPPKAIVGLNPALEPFKGSAGILFPMMAKALAVNPFTAPTLSRMATTRAVAGLIEGTGSQIDAVGLARYRDCMADRAHVDGTLTMMAQWHPESLQTLLPKIAVPTLFLVGDQDRAVPPATSTNAAKHMPWAKAVRLTDLGHLAHEEDPETVADHIECFLQQHVVMSPRGHV